MTDGDEQATGIHVIKIGGNEMNAGGFLAALAAGLARLAAAAPLVVVHGGGQDIATLQSRLGIAPVMVDGLRVTDAESLAVAQMVLSGHTNKQVVRALLAAGLDAIGLSGVDGRLLTCRRKHHPTVDLGLVGEVTAVRAGLLRRLLAGGITPVVSPISLGEDGQTYNVNADTVAGAIAGSLNAKRMLLLTDVAGVKGADGEIIRQMTLDEAQNLIDTGVATGGMIPKLETAIAAVESGVEAVVILDGRRPHAMLTELFTEHGSGTLIRA